jgi:hypothetical protein|nr:MAG TPA: hypothetical protein [Caudoviricetes sp.]
MKIEVNDNLKWFLESLINEGFDKFYINNLTGVVFVGSKKFNPNVNFITSEMFKACPGLEKDTIYNIQDFLNGEIEVDIFEFGDKLFYDFAGGELSCIFLQYKNKKDSIILTQLLNTVSIPTKYLRRERKVK